LTPEQQKAIDEAKNKNAEIAKENLRRADLMPSCARLMPWKRRATRPPIPPARCRTIARRLIF